MRRDWIGLVQAPAIGFYLPVVMIYTTFIKVFIIYVSKMNCILVP